MTTPGGGDPNPGPYDQGHGYGTPEQPTYTQPTYTQPTYDQPTYDQPTAAAPGYGAPAQAPRNGLGIAALVLGILAILSSWIPVAGVVGILLAIVGIVLGFIGRGRAKRGEATNGGMAVTGAVLGIIALVIGLAVQIFFGFFAASVFHRVGGGQVIQQAEQCIRQQQRQGASQAQAQQFCQQEIQRQIERRYGG